METRLYACIQSVYKPRDGLSSQGAQTWALHSDQHAWFFVSNLDKRRPFVLLTLNSQRRLFFDELYNS